MSTNQVTTPTDASARSIKIEAHVAQTLVNLHIAEYQALTSRNTNWITLQYALWPILGLALSLLAPLTNTPYRILAFWGGTAIVQAVAFAYYVSLIEVYRNVRYIEKKLRQSLQDIIGEHPFWGYENYLHENRDRRVFWFECFPLVLSFGALGFASYNAVRPWSFWDYAGFLFNALCLIIAVYLAAKTSKTRKELFSPL